MGVPSATLRAKFGAEAKSKAITDTMATETAAELTGGDWVRTRHFMRLNPPRGAGEVRLLD